LNKEELVQIANTPASVQNMYGDGGVQITNTDGGHIQLFFINSGSNVRLDAFRFNTEFYNLFVINDKIDAHGTFTIPIKDCLLHTAPDAYPEGKITIALLERILTYPSLIATPNAQHLTAYPTQCATICKVHRYEILDDAIKFRYLVSKEFQQQPLNEIATTLGILASEQSNELDHCHWEIKHVNLLEILKLEDEYEGKK